MIHFTRPLSDLRRTDEVTLRKDASRQYGKDEPQFSIPQRDAVVRVGEEAKARLGRAEENVRNGGASAEIEPGVPPSRPAPSRAVLERALKSFGSEKDAQERGLRAPALPLIERADQGVPYDVLQRAAAAQDVEPQTDPEEKNPLPFTDDSPLLDSGAEDSPVRTAFEVPEKVGEPYGRDVPFDLTEEELATQGAEASGALRASGNTDEAVRDAGAIAGGDLERQVDGSAKDAVAIDIDREVLDTDAQLRLLEDDADEGRSASSSSEQRADQTGGSSAGADSVALLTRTKLQRATDAYRAAERELEMQRAQALSEATQLPSAPLSPGFALMA